jgi:hypothetical protein
MVRELLLAGAWLQDGVSTDGPFDFAQGERGGTDAHHRDAKGTKYGRRSVGLP